MSRIWFREPVSGKISAQRARRTQRNDQEQRNKIIQELETLETKNIGLLINKKFSSLLDLCAPLRSLF
jgi:hypothetical protein